MSHATAKIEPAHSKIVSLPALLITWVVLCALASVSAFLGTVDLHGLSTLVSVVIASIMAIVAALYFMHLRYDHPFYIIMLVLTLIFITIFISFSLTDTTAYKDQLIQGEAPAMVKARKADAAAAQAAQAAQAKPAAPVAK